MPEFIKIRRGLNIQLKGQAEKTIKQAEQSSTFAIKPTDFHGIIPKLMVKSGDKVKAGSPLFFNKHVPDMLFTSPVSGTIMDVNRGKRRRILEVIIKADETIDYLKFKKNNIAELSIDSIKKHILASGIWPAIRQRPYDIIANPNHTPKSIFVSAFDTAPLAPDIGFILENNEKEFQTGLDVLEKLTNGSVYLNLNKNGHYPEPIKKAQNVKIHYFSGPHPSGNTGIQIHKLDPVNKGDIVWSINPSDVIILGRFFQNGIYDAKKLIAITGSEVIKPMYYQTTVGTGLKPLIEGNLKDHEELRIISGNPLTGKNIGEKGYLGYYDYQLSVIPEGANYDFLGWLKPGFNKFSMSRTFLSWITPTKKYALNANMNGDERAYVMSGQYEKVLPMDILPVHLIKSILAEDIDKMEQLGIYEVAPEDLALCEFVCTSKIRVQDIIRKGLDTMIKELG